MGAFKQPDLDCSGSVNGRPIRGNSPIERIPARASHREYGTNARCWSEHAGSGRRVREIGVSSFRQDVETAIPALRRYARALTRETEAADDLVQDTLVRALRSEHLFHGGDVRSWLYTILTNLNR